MCRDGSHSQGSHGYLPACLESHKVPTTSLGTSSQLHPVGVDLFRTSNFIGPGRGATLLFLGLGSIVLLFALLLFEPILWGITKGAGLPNSSIDNEFKGKYEAEQEFPEG